MIQRIFKHLCFSKWRSQALFPKELLTKISQMITQSEDTHGGELRVVIQSSLPLGSILKNVNPRDCAIQSFTELKIWDTEYNSGVLIFLMLADHAVEIVADRGFNGKVTAEAWSEICRDMEHHFKQEQYEQAVSTGIQSINALITKYFPHDANKRNELPDEVVMK